MTEAELIAAVAARSDHTQVAVRTLLRVLVGEVEEVLRGGEGVALPGLGKLKPVTKAARQGRNPKTGERIDIPSRSGVKFVPAKALVRALES